MYRTCERRTEQGLGSQEAGQGGRVEGTGRVPGTGRWRMYGQLSSRGGGAPMPACRKANNQFGGALAPEEGAVGDEAGDTGSINPRPALKDAGEPLEAFALELPVQCFREQVRDRQGRSPQYLEEETRRKSTALGARPMFESQFHHLLPV